MVLYVLPKDQEIVREMLPNIIKEVEKKKRRKIRIKIADLKGNYIGGIIVQSVDGREYYNNTLDSRVRLIEEELFKIVISIVQKK